MWYVNIAPPNPLLIIDSCFILTMWYVNYLYKFSTLFIFSRFILTMWYVKEANISGVVYIVMDSEGACEFKIAKEMKESEYQIDLNKIL
ncbi:Uncharacterised protein [Clostridioides difficile]|nr:Uncharacterised protein [Clostridioides difficile]SJR08128.1 Uncharacterised protein [Clostridioides difficile]SJV42158.1 Uncharacterised protein [Clostridioides difficile]SJW82300.1 Uncharacterised protein [Clostridioides difficile]